MTTHLAQTLKLLLVIALAASAVGQTATAARAQEPSPPAGPVCFFQDGHPTCVLRDAPAVSAMSAVPPEHLLTALLAGPSPAEQSQRIQSAIPAGTQLVSAETEGDTISVRLAFPPGFLNFDPNFSEMMLAAGLPRIRLTSATSDAIVYQVATTLDPLGYRHVHVEAEDPNAPGSFRPISAYLPAIEVPPKGDWPPGSLPPQSQPPLDLSGRPQGALSGKTIYLSAGHGWYWNGYLWRTQRPPYPNRDYDGPIIEDHNNAEVINQYLTRYLWNAGADVWTVRERDMHPLEQVVDDQSASFVATGGWQTVGQGGYGLQPAAQPDRVGHHPAAARLVWAAVVRPLGADLLLPSIVRSQASRPSAPAEGGYLTAATTSNPVASATATWTTPPVEQEGIYALYAWYVPGPDRAPDAHYTIHHAGGATELSLDQRHHGVTWRYLGSYPVRAGEGVTVILDNRSDQPGSLVVADAIRLGGGSFDSLAGMDTEAPYPPDEPWWEVSAYYHAQRLGMDPDEWAYFDDVTARPFWAKWEHAQTGDDPVYISWHTNGYNGYNDRVWGTVSYIHDYQPVPGSAALQHFVHAELINDVRAGWDPDWRDLGQKSRNLGEVRELWDDDPALAIPGLLLEVAYHDHVTNTDALKDPRFAQLSARAVYQGVVKYYADKDGLGVALLPEPPTHLTVRNAGPGQVSLSWRPPPSDGVGLSGQPAERYRVYTSPDGLSWDAGQPVYATQHTLTGLEAYQLIFVRITALNPGGESFPSPVLAARVSPYGAANILIVDGFDRIDRHGLILEDDPVEGLNARMFLEQINSFDYSREHGGAIPFPFDSALNEAVADGELTLAEYSLVDWFLGEEASVDHTFDEAEQSALAAYLDGGGGLLVSGSEIGWELDILDSGREFYRTYLRATCLADDAGTYLSAPAGGSLWLRLVEAVLSAARAAGVEAVLSAARAAGAAPASRFALPEQIPFVDNYDVDFADQLAPLNSTPWLRYVGGLGGTAAVLHDGGGCRKLIYLAFPFETIEAEERTQVMSWILNWFSQDCLNLYGQHLAHLPILLKGYPPPEAEPPPPEPPPEATRTPTPPPASTNLIPNGGFETDAGWDLLSTGHPAAYVTDPVHGGQRAGQAQVSAGQAGYSSLSTSVDLPDQSPLTLSFWFYPSYEDYGTGDLQYVSLTDAQGATYVLWRARQNDRQWLQVSLDLSPYRGQRIVLRFGVSNDGDYRTAGLVVDDVSLPVVAE